MKRNILSLVLCFIFSTFSFLVLYYYRTDSRATFAFADGVEKTVYLTFDDGPTDSTTPYVLDELKKANVKATFFLIGQQAKRRPALTTRIVAEGHAVGVHSYTHVYSRIYHSKAALLEDVEACRQTIFDLTGIATSLYRFPGGSFSVRKELIDCITTAGYTYYDWNASCRDAELIGASPDELVGYAKSTFAGQDEIILLCHDFARHKNIALALPKIISFYKEKGYRFGTLSA